jgi:hypothetical protein
VRPASVVMDAPRFDGHLQMAFEPRSNKAMHAVRKQWRGTVGKISGADRNAQHRTSQDVTICSSDSRGNPCRSRDVDAARAAELAQILPPKGNWPAEPPLPTNSQCLD